MPIEAAVAIAGLFGLLAVYRIVQAVRVAASAPRRRSPGRASPAGNSSTRASPPGLVVGGDLIPWDECAKGLFAYGAPGSGKSHFLLSLVRQLAGRAFLVITTVKPTDHDDVRRIFAELGMPEKLVRLGKGSPHRIDIGQFFTAGIPQGGGSPRVLAKALTMAGEVLNNTGKGQGEAFWQQLIADVAYFSSLLAILATGRADLSDIYQIVMSLPSSPEDLASDGFVADRPCGQMLLRANLRRTPQTEAPYRQVLDFMDRIAGLGSKAKTAGQQGALSTLSGLVIEFGEQVVGGSTVDLAELERSKGCLLIDGAPMINHAAGKAFNFLNACAVQFFAMARDPAHLDVPTFLVRDECGWILNSSHDAQIQAVSRSQKLASIAAAQNLPILTAGLGGDDRAKHEAKAFASMHNRLYFFANSCSETNSWASELCGQERQLLIGGSSGQDQGADFLSRAFGATANHSWNQQMLPAVRPEEFGRSGVGRCYEVANGRHRFLDFTERRPR